MLNPSPEYVLRELYAARARGDIEAMLRYCSDDVIFAMYLPRDVVPFGGEAHGKPAGRAAMHSIAKHFALVYFLPVGIVMLGQLARAQVRYCFRHRASALELDGVMRHEVLIEHNLITCMREYHDTERIRAFMRLATDEAAPEVRLSRRNQNS